MKTCIAVSDNPCCSFPCQNQGICYTKGFDAYACDCTRTGYYGQHCEYGNGIYSVPVSACTLPSPRFVSIGQRLMSIFAATLSTRITKLLKPSRNSLQHLVTNYKFLWNVVNNIYSLRMFFMGLVLKGQFCYDPLSPRVYVT